MGTHEWEHTNGNTRVGAHQASGRSSGKQLKGSRRHLPKTHNQPHIAEDEDPRKCVKWQLIEWEHRRRGHFSQERGVEGQALTHPRRYSLEVLHAFFARSKQTACSRAEWLVDPLSLTLTRACTQEILRQPAARPVSPLFPSLFLG